MPSRSTSTGTCTISLRERARRIELLASFILGNKTKPPYVQRSMPMSKWRVLASQALLAAPGVWFLSDWLRSHHRPATEFLFGAAIVGGAALLGRRGVVAQVLGRGVAWSLFAPCLIAVAVELVSRRWPELGVLALGGATGTALALARPMLETREAKAAFAPHAYRRSLLFGASSAVAASVLIGGIALATVSPAGHGFGPALALGIEALALLAAGIGVARMRAWGILLGAATALMAPLVALAVTDFAPARLLLMTAGLPGMLLVAVIVAARARSAVAPPFAAGVRVASSPARVRVASVADDDLDIHFDDASLAPARTRA